MESNKVTSFLEGSWLADVVRPNLEQFPGAAPEQIERTWKWVDNLRTQLVALVRDIDDPDQIPTTLAIYYIECKSHWIALNTKVNYQNFRHGSCDVETALRGAAISQILARVETLLTADDINQITEFLAQPISRQAA
ncbi:MAG: hypothetical protein SFZ23_07760 [Planctomycetota bacterium]|nr:hypothetical protein [Planctomycetota bacterium]